MKSIVASLLIFFCSCTPVCFGQVVYNKEYKVFEPIVIKVDGQVEPDVKRTVLWDANFRFVETPGALFGWAPPGNYKFSGTIFQTKEIKLENQTYPVLVGLPTIVRGEFTVTPDGPHNPNPPPVPPGPNPPVPPNPVANCDDVPGDIFDNLGKRVCGWSVGLPKRKEVGQVFEKWSGRLMKDQTLTINSAAEQMVAERDAVLGTDAAAYKPFMDKLQEELNRRWPMGKGTMANFYGAISAGLQNGN